MPLPVIMGAAIILVAGALVLGVFLSRCSAPPLIRLLVFSAVVGHFLLGCAMQFGGVDSDALGYHLDATQLSQYWSGEEISAPTMTDGKAGWAWSMAIPYLLFGPHEVMGIAINAILVAAAPLQMFAIARPMLGDAVARRAALLVWMLPAAWLWGSLPLREASVTFILLLSLHALIKVARGGRATWWAGLIGALLLLVAFRGSMAIVVTAAALAALVLVRRDARWAAAPKVILVPMALSLAVVGQFALDTGGSDLSVDRISAIQASQSASANSRFDVQSAPQSVTDIVLTLPMTLPRAALGPFPWELSSIPVALLVDAVYWWGLVALAVVGFRRRHFVDRRNLAFMLLVPLLGLLIALAIYSGNYGTMIRIRATGAIYIIPFAALAMQTQRKDSLQRAANALKVHSVSRN